MRKQRRIYERYFRDRQAGELAHSHAVHALAVFWLETVFTTPYEKCLFTQSLLSFVRIFDPAHHYVPISRSYRWRCRSAVCPVADTNSTDHHHHHHHHFIYFIQIMQWNKTKEHKQIIDCKHRQCLETGLVSSTHETRLRWWNIVVSVPKIDVSYVPSRCI